ncbi:MAG TPA: dTDP-4-dehydrorhamnose 3,5-epimerase family protein, partial [Chitinophagaceae bacterium]|nr:dTDP-4-dehydrorhamnose 3,5-epimerase family protein [Chitinophagaceae bacterium]
MQRINTPLDGCFILKPSIFSDHRGYFYESYNRKDFNRIAEFDAVFVQDNQALSNYGTVRGLHFQKGEWAQAKLV